MLIIVPVNLQDRIIISLRPNQYGCIFKSSSFWSNAFSVIIRAIIILMIRIFIQEFTRRHVVLLSTCVLIKLNVGIKRGIKREGGEE